MVIAERSLVIIKHDGVARGIIGQIISRFERVGLKLIAFELIQSTQDMGSSHYPNSKKWLETVGYRTLKDYEAKGIDPIKELGTNDAEEIGKLVKNWLVDYLTYGPVLAMVWEGPGAVKVIRKLVGDTIPANAMPGTIRGDFSLDNVELANKQNRPFYNLIHASGEITEAEEEIKLWFEDKEIFQYKNYNSPLMGIYGKLGQ
jgi:nucleoside-diphosphate kinase